MTAAEYEEALHRAAAVSRALPRDEAAETELVAAIGDALDCLAAEGRGSGLVAKFELIDGAGWLISLSSGHSWGPFARLGTALAGFNFLYQLPAAEGDGGSPRRAAPCG
jgi:hypothetical protein